MIFQGVPTTIGSGMYMVYDKETKTYGYSDAVFYPADSGLQNKLYYANIEATKAPLTNGGSVYEIIEDGSDTNTVAYVKPMEINVTNVVIPDEILIDGTSYKVSFIAANAFRNNKKLTGKKIGKNAFKGVGSKYYKKVVVKVPSKKYVKKYKALLRKKGLSVKVKIENY